jgi:hypothetical protein
MHLTPEEQALWRVSLSLLERFVPGETGILPSELEWDGAQLRLVSTPSPRNTAEVAKALCVLRRHNQSCPLDPDVLIDRIVEHYLAGLEYPDVALTLWADALAGGRHHSTLWDALMRGVPRRAGETMFLAWTLGAVCHCLDVTTRHAEVTATAHDLAGRILGNQVRKTGLFHASSQRAGWRRQRLPVATLAVQAYAVQALALYGRTLRVPDVVVRAERCADALCRLQGAQGQWWHSYDVHDGTVVDRFPLYTAHQVASVPMALDELHAAAQHRRFRLCIVRGLAWIRGDNELSMPIVDETTGVLWSGLAQTAGTLSILRTIKSYLPGRCLYWLCTRPA